MNKQTEATQYIKATLAAFGPGEAISITQDTWAKLHEAMSVLIKRPAQQEPVAHPDEVAIDRFAAAMKAKMAKQRAKGYGGWEDKADCPASRLQQMLVDHIAKGDPVDVANFTMMLWNRGEHTEQPQLTAEQ
jgi:hypothetical protein